MNLRSQTLAYFILSHLNSDPLSWGGGRCHLGGVRALSPSWAQRLQGGIYGPWHMGLTSSSPQPHGLSWSCSQWVCGGAQPSQFTSGWQSPQKGPLQYPSESLPAPWDPLCSPLSHSPWPSALLLLWAFMKGQKNIGLLVAFAFNSARIPEASKS